MFIEIGSQMKYWKEPIAGALIADALIAGIRGLGTSKPPAIIGIGGLHTCPSFNKIAMRKQAMPGHVCPSYMLENLTPALVQQMVEKTRPAPTAIVLDWKGLKQSKEHVKDVLEQAGLSIPVKKTKEYSNDIQKD
jgi:D-aminoacyl-tRNA deacylase